MSSAAARIEENYRGVTARIALACARATRDPREVMLIAVTKYARDEWVRELIDLGHGSLGESRPKQIIERHAKFGPGVQWHLIGHLQRNKARKVLPLVTLVHSVDSLKLLETIDRLAEELSIRPGVLLEVNVAGEASKDGFSVESLRAAWPDILKFRHVEVRGLMTMAPPFDDPQRARPVFRTLRNLRDELAKSHPPLKELSMGMSNDFEVAIEEGATMVRIGSLLFEGLDSAET